MPNKDAGTIIGKAGATIQLIQKKSGARVKVSNATDFSPWTEARVVGITGPKNKIARAIAAILSEVFDDHEQRKTATGKSATPVGSESITAQILIPELSCGLVRALLNKMEADSSAKIKLTPQNKQPPGTQERILTVFGNIQQERILTVFGNIQQVSDGAEAVVNTIYEDPECKYINSSTEYQQGGNSNQGGNNHNGGSGGTPRAAMPRGGRGGQMQTSGNFDLQMQTSGNFDLQDPNVAAFQGNFNQGNNQGNNQNNNRGNNNNNNGNTQDNNFGNNNGNSLNGSFGGNQNQGNLGLGGWAGSIDAGAWTNCTGCGKLTDPSWPACPTCGELKPRGPGLGPGGTDRAASVT
ncbi:hypothetical protein T484DRAFT_1782635 [Baffinella frigidus]|nr:hypothetical protein T484DRAFT_1782635 [Cryptophyta sp. CCMP2293]